MKQLIITLLIIACYNTSINSQTNRFEKPIPSTFINTYVSPDWDNLNKAFEYAKSVHDRNAQIVDNMIDALYTLKGKTDNVAFKNKLDDFLTDLKTLRLGSLVQAESLIKKIDWAIRDEIEKYNSGSYSAPNTTSVRNEKEYSPGSYVKTAGGGPIRERAYVSSNAIGNTDNFKVVKIIQKVSENFYAIEFNNLKGFISKGFLWEIASKESYDEFYSSKEALSNQKDNAKR